MRLVFHECRKSGRPFGQTLVERGLVTFPVLRTALRQQTAEALAGLTLLEKEPHWVPSPVTGYSASAALALGSVVRAGPVAGAP